MDHRLYAHFNHILLYSKEAIQFTITFIVSMEGYGELSKLSAFSLVKAVLK